MRIAQVRITNGFKRFSDLKVGQIPQEARLIVLLGGNGSGKSSFMDALLWWYLRHYAPHRGHNAAPDYYQRPGQGEGPNIEVEAHGEEPGDQTTRARAMHFRSAYRYTNDVSSSSINRLMGLEFEGVDTLSGEDRAVVNHYNRLVAKGTAAFSNISTVVSNQDVYGADVVPLAKSFNRIFPDLTLTSLGNPTEGGSFMFTKGAVTDFRYINLSSGEKAVFDLLLDLHIRRIDYPNSVVCLDEPEAHTGLRVQGQLLDEMLSIIPGAQLWLATHSVGMMRRAFEIAHAKPDEVVFLKFDEVDFDEPAELKPELVDRALWKRIHAVALEDLAVLVGPSRVYLCEGEPNASRDKADFDAAVYRKIFGDEFPETDFVSVGGASEQPKIKNAVTALAAGANLVRVIDRDSRTPEEIERLKLSDSSLRILSERDIENFLLCDEVLEIGSMKYRDDSPTEVAATLVEEKESLLATQKYDDDVKAIAGQLFEEIKKAWQLTQGGTSRHAFMRDICAPLITPDTRTYARLSVDLGL